jgi:hypothetical protein
MADKKPKKQQDTSALSRILQGQLSKSEKRVNAFTSITKSKQRAHQAVKEVKLRIRLSNV